MIKDIQTDRPHNNYQHSRIQQQKWGILHVISPVAMSYFVFSLCLCFHCLKCFPAFLDMKSFDTFDQCSVTQENPVFSLDSNVDYVVKMDVRQIKELPSSSQLLCVPLYTGGCSHIEISN